MSVLATIGAIFASIIGIAASIGATNLADKFETARNSDKGIDSDTIIKSINQLTSYARGKGNKVINDLNNRLGAIQLPVGASPAVKDAIISNRRELASLLKRSQNTMNEVELTLTDADQRANNLAASPEATRAVIGERTKKDIQKDIEPAIQKVDNLEKEVEKYVSK